MFRFFELFLGFLLLVIPSTVHAISDLHIAVDSSLSLPFRKIIKEYARSRSMVITADFQDSSNLFKDLERGRHLIVSVSTAEPPNHLNGVAFASDKLYLCLAKTSSLRRLIKSRDTLGTVLELLKKHSVLVVPDSGTELGKIINNLVLKLGVDRSVEIKNFENLGYTVVSSGAFAILPGSTAMQHESAGLEKLFEIPQELYPEIRYNVTVLEDKGIAQSREFVKFLFLGEVHFHELGFYKEA